MGKRSLRRELDDRGIYRTVGKGNTMAEHPDDPDHPAVSLVGRSLTDAGVEAQAYYDANAAKAWDAEHDEAMQSSDEYAARWIVANLLVSGYIE